MAAHAHVTAIRAAVAQLNAGDVDGYLAAFTADCRRWLPGLADPVDRSDLRLSLDPVMRAISGFRLEEMVLFGQGRHVCARWRLVGTHAGDQLGIPATGRAVAVETAEIYEFERDDGGLVRETWVFGDPMALFHQIGGDAA